VLFHANVRGPVCAISRKRAWPCLCYFTQTCMALFVLFHANVRGPVCAISSKCAWPCLCCFTQTCVALFVLFHANSRGPVCAISRKLAWPCVTRHVLSNFPDRHLRHYHLLLIEKWLRRGPRASDIVQIGISDTDRFS